MGPVTSAVRICAFAGANINRERINVKATIRFLLRIAIALLTLKKSFKLTTGE